MHARSVVLHVSHTLKAGEHPNLFFVCVRTHTRVYACGVSVDYVDCVYPKLYLIKKSMASHLEGHVSQKVWQVTLEHMFPIF
jgi:hypothetical protein